MKNQVFIGVWINIRVFNWSTSLFFMSIPSCFHYCSSIIELNVRNGDASGSSFIVQDCLGYPEFFCFPYEVDYCSFKVCKKCVGIFTEIAMNL